MGDGKGRQGPHSRGLIRWQELTLAVAVFAACAGFFLVRQDRAQTGTTAVISLDGAEIRRVTLGADDDYRIGLAEEYGVPVSFEVKGGAIRFVDVTCPDHLCEKTGFVSTEGATAVCMPNRTAVTVVTG